MSRVDFFTSHEGLNLHYESAQTRTVPRFPGHYDLTTHLPWIGERTRALEIRQVRTIQEAEIEAQKAVEAARIARQRARERPSKPST